MLADDVFVDCCTKKKVISGTFNRLWSSEFPTQFSRATKAYVVLTNCRGKVNLELRYVDLLDDSVLMQTQALELEGSDPLSSVEFIIEVPPFPMPHDGYYAFELYCGANRLGGMRLRVDKVNQDQRKQP